MNKRLKISLIAASVPIALILIAVLIFLRILGEAIREDCEKTNHWTIEDYQIQEYRCIGFAGPHFYRFYLYKNGLEIDEGNRFDSCIIRFRPQNDLCLSFNVCSNQVTELKPMKNTLTISEVDSVIMFNLESSMAKNLTRKEIDDFVKKWNAAPVFDFRDDKIPFYPSSSYLIKVYCKNDIREFETGNFMIKDGENWTYNFLEDNEKTGTKKFDEMWERLKQPPTSIANK